MSRKKRVHDKQQFLSDANYDNELVAKFIRTMLLHGKKSVSEKIFYNAIQILESKGKKGLDIFSQAIENVQPEIEVRSRRLGGSSFQVPVEVDTDRKQSLAIRWIIQSARARSGRSMQERLAAELLDAYNKTGKSYKKKEEIRKMADSNRVFVNYSF